MAAPIHPVKVTLCAPGPGGESLGSYGSATITWTRPENTTDYTAGDVIGVADSGTPANAGSAIFEIPNIGPAGGHVFITDVALEIALSAITSGMTSFRFEVYDASPTAILDNAAWDLGSGDRSKHLTTIGNVVPVDKGSTLKVVVSGVNQKVKLAEGSTSLWFELVTEGAYTPASGTAYKARFETVAA
jgi:hypothetical protein